MFRNGAALLRHHYVPRHSWEGLQGADHVVRDAFTLFRNHQFEEESVRGAIVVSFGEEEGEILYLRKSPQNFLHVVQAQRLAS